MKIMTIVSIFRMLVYVLAFHDYAEAQYAISHSVVGSGGALINNGSYRLSGTAGQPAIGVISNPSHINEAGFWYQAHDFITTIEQISNDLPKEFHLRQNYPNPFNPGTTIEFALPKFSFVTLTVYNQRGEQVAILIEEQREAGIHQFNWNAGGLASGVYLYRLEAGEFMQTRKLILIK